MVIADAAQRQYRPLSLQRLSLTPNAALLSEQPASRVACGQPRRSSPPHNCTRRNVSGCTRSALTAVGGMVVGLGAVGHTVGVTPPRTAAASTSVATKASARSRGRCDWCAGRQSWCVATTPHASIVVACSSLVFGSRCRGANQRSRRRRPQQPWLQTGRQLFRRHLDPHAEAT